MNGRTVRIASLVMGGAVGISTTGICLTGGPTTFTKNLQVTALTGGTGSFQSLVVAGKAVVGEDATFSGSLNIGGAVSSTQLWGGVATMATSLAVPQYAIGSSYNGNALMYRLGTWTAPLGGHVLKLNYLGVWSADSRCVNLLLHIELGRQSQPRCR